MAVKLADHWEVSLAVWTVSKLVDWKELLMVERLVAKKTARMDCV